MYQHKKYNSYLDNYFNNEKNQKEASTTSNVSNISNILNASITSNISSQFKEDVTVKDGKITYKSSKVRSSINFYNRDYMKEEEDELNR